MKNLKIGNGAAFVTMFQVLMGSSKSSRNGRRENGSTRVPRPRLSVLWRDRAGGSTLRSELYTREMTTGDDKRLKMFVIPCSCGTTFAVAENYDRQGTAWSRYLKCPNCEKRHDPKNRLLQIGYQREGYWKVDDC